METIGIVCVNFRAGQICAKKLIEESNELPVSVKRYEIRTPKHRYILIPVKNFDHKSRGYRFDKVYLYLVSLSRRQYTRLMTQFTDSDGEKLIEISEEYGR